MADTLEIRLGGTTRGRPITTRDLDFGEVRPLIVHLETAALIEAGIDAFVRSSRLATNKGRRELDPARLALDSVYTAEDRPELGAVYHFVLGDETAEAVGKITAGLTGRRDIRLVPGAANQVREGLRRTIRKGLSVQLVNGVATPVFNSANPPPDLAAHPTRTFESEVAAKVLRVGGKKPAARVQLLGSGQEVTLDLSGPKAAQSLGPHLYHHVVFRGAGEWVIDPERFSAPTRLLKFAVTSYRVLKPAFVDDLIDEMTEATGGAWDDIDPTDPEQVTGAVGG